MSPVIPFFSDLHPKAIPAVQQLFDETRAEGYSLPIVYSSFVSRLSAAGVSAPARKLVKQWLAGVQLGSFMRPETPNVPGATAAATPAPDVDYFGCPPVAAVPALGEAWDAIRGAIGGDIDIEADEEERAYDDFFAAARALELPEPSWRAFVSWAKRIRAGEITRPAVLIAEEPPTIQALKEAAPAELSADPAPKRRGRRVKADVLIVDPANSEAVRPDIMVEADPETGKILQAEVVMHATGDGGSDATAAEREDARPVPAFAALKSAASRLLDEVLAQLSANIEQAAREATARMLREVADDMESSGAC
ncbi:UNVERIFIED_ORG: hypothetical protein LHK14_00310 [Roseateles sp. XES5]|nr:hypothetical protein [Roseateles sp. XES5]